MGPTCPEDSRVELITFAQYVEPNTKQSIIDYWKGEHVKKCLRLSSKTQTSFANNHADIQIPNHNLDGSKVMNIRLDYDT